MSGWTVDDVFDLSWDQIQVVSECVASYRSLQLDILMEIVGAALGSKKSPKKGKKKPASPIDQIAALGFPIETQGG